jgi:hypothetical protein
MKKNNTPIELFTHRMSERVAKISDRAVALLYFYAVKKDTGVTLKQLVGDFDRAGLGKPNITKLRKVMKKDRRTAKIAEDSWRLKSDKVAEVESEFQLSRCLGKEDIKLVAVDGGFVDKKRFQAIQKKKTKFDFSRFLQMLTELDHAFSMESHISVILLVRAILDHVPPIFGYNTFAEVANNYSTRSFKDSMLHLENSSRKIADSYLHTKIRSKESLPSKTQVNFSNDVDVLLAEIVRITN